MRVLVAIDGSAGADVAVRTVAERRTSDDDAARVLCVVRGVTVVGVEGIAGGLSAEIDPAAEAEAHRVALTAAEQLTRHGLRAEPVVRHGDPRDVILDEARAWGADLIVLGSQGRRGLGRLLFGSVAEHVARHAACSVEIARDKDAGRASAGDIASLFAPPPWPGHARR